MKLPSNIRLIKVEHGQLIKYYIQKRILWFWDNYLEYDTLDDAESSFNRVVALNNSSIKTRIENEYQSRCPRTFLICCHG
jgi:hypothetical protein